MRTPELAMFVLAGAGLLTFMGGMLGTVSAVLWTIFIGVDGRNENRLLRLFLGSMLAVTVGATVFLAVMP